MNERWLPIAGYEGCYEVSSLGRVRSLDRVDSSGARRRGGVRKYTKLKPYPQICLSKQSKVRCFDVHGLVLRAFKGPRPQGYEARHLDGDTSNAKLSNLAWGTVEENTADKFKHGTVVRGEAHGRAKLSACDVRSIRGSSEPRVVLAQRFSVSKNHITRIRSGGRWAQ